MSIPYNNNLELSVYQTDPNWYQNLPEEADSLKTAFFSIRIAALKKELNEYQGSRAAWELLDLTFMQPVKRSVQFIRDGARLVLKVPIRAIATPIFLEKNWRERERAKINAKLTGYAFVQLTSVPAKFIVALIAIVTSAFSQEKAKWLLDTSKAWTKHNDGRTSQLEALKEEGAKKAQSRQEFDEYRTWLYSIDPKLCRKKS